MRGAPASRWCAEVAELADAQASGACGRKVVEVRVLSSAPILTWGLRPQTPCSLTRSTRLLLKSNWPSLATFREARVLTARSRRRMVSETIRWVMVRDPRRRSPMTPHFSVKVTVIVMTTATG
jgi:hypothetical protein